MTLKPVKVAVIGCGVISDIYLTNSAKWYILDVVAVSDLDMERARSKAAKYSIPKALTVDEVLADPEIELILNLTIPAAHGPLALRALKAGKSVYNEKPLAISREDAQAMLTEAAARGLRVGGAPDTFLGAGLQTCRKLIDAGAIGQPVAALAYMMSRGPDKWHPDPDFFFKVGAGPLFDMAPYYLTALISLFGPIRRVTASGRITYPVRKVHAGPKAGATIQVETPTHISSVLEFASGPIATLVTSFDVWDGYRPYVEVNGSAGTMGVPDPNTFGGPVKLHNSDADTAAHEEALAFGNAENSRALGLADMAYAIRTGRPHRASGQLTYHVLDVMHAILEAAKDGRHVEIASTCQRPAPLPQGLAAFTLDE